MSCGNNSENTCCRLMSDISCRKNNNNDYVVCTCMEVTYAMIMASIQQGADTFDKLSDVLGVGTGCSSCVSEIEEILKQK